MFLVPISADAAAAAAACIQQLTSAAAHDRPAAGLVYLGKQAPIGSPLGKYLPTTEKNITHVSLLSGTNMIVTASC